MNPAERQIQSLLLEHSSECQMDGASEILFALSLRQHTGLSKEVMLFGQLNKFKLWDEYIPVINKSKDDIDAELSVALPVYRPAARFIAIAMSENDLHTTVLLNEAVKGLNLRPDGVYLDGTFGRGGHSRLILSKLNSQGRLFAIDRDPAAVEAAHAIEDVRFTIIHGPFSAMADYMEERDLLGRVDGILLDLGISSPLLDDPERGFSFMRDGPLDMRMDTTRGQSAAQWMAKASTEDIAWVLKTFGEERFAERIAQAISARNRQQPIIRTRELATLIADAIPFRDKYKHPATRSFQAIRIYINSELKEIERALDSTLTVLAFGGRLSVISFHSLEDRLVKDFIRRHSRRPQMLASLPLTEAQIAAQHQDRRQLKAAGKMQPSAQEINDNPRARSSVLRFAEKLTP